MTIGEHIAAMREFYGWTQGRLAERAGLSVTVINDVEHDHNVMLRTLRRIAQALHTRFTIGRDDYPKPFTGPLGRSLAKPGAQK